jgi:hypothetical protein
MGIRRLLHRLGAVLTLVGVLVSLLPLVGLGTGSGANGVEGWCADKGIKYDGVNALTFTVPDAPDGYGWTLLVLKAGRSGHSVDEENFVVHDPVAGQSYSWQGTWQGSPIEKEISHAILCKEKVPSTTPSSTTSSTTTSTTTHDEECPDLQALSGGHDGKEDCEEEECPDLQALSGDHDGKAGDTDDCDDDDDDDDDDDCPVEVKSGDKDDCDEESTTTTTIPDSSTTTTIAGVTVTTMLDIAAVGAECRNDIPFFAYDVDWPGGGTATITFINPMGADIVHENMPLSGAVLWPGANDDPADWPGWILQDGVWVEADDGFLWARGTMQVQFEVNPTAIVSVSYPPAGAACAGPRNASVPRIPDVVGGVTITPPPVTDEVEAIEQLPFTGVDTGPLMAVALAILALGTLLVVSTRDEEPEGN